MRLFAFILFFFVTTRIASQDTGADPLFYLKSYIAANIPELSGKTISEVGYRDAPTVYRDIVKLKWFNTSFGIEGNFTEGGAVVLFFDAYFGLEDGLIYGAFASQTNSTALQNNNWLTGIQKFGGKVYSTDYRRQALLVESQFHSRTNDILFKAWSLSKFNTRVIVVTFGTTRLSHCTYRLPGIYGSLSRHELTYLDFSRDDAYKNYGSVRWGVDPASLYKDITMWYESNQPLVISGSQLHEGSLPPPDFALDVWGKTLIRDQEAAPPINSSYEYRLWVAGNMVSEDFIIQPKEKWADHVFDDDYTLPDLKAVEKYIREKGRLPAMPAQEEIKAGYLQHEQNRRLLESIEQLTLYKIGHFEKSQQLQQQSEANQRKLDALLEATKPLKH